MSFDSIGIPVAVCAPETVQSLDPGRKTDSVNSSGSSESSSLLCFLPWTTAGFFCPGRFAGADSPGISFSIDAPSLPGG